MRPKAIILIVIASGCGLVASVGITQVLDSKNTKQVPAVEMVKIFVAIEDIDINESLTAEMVKLEEWPKDRVPEGALSKIEDVELHLARDRIYTGAPIFSRNLFGSDEDRGASKLIPTGYRSIAVRVTAESAASGLILPGDRVDVLIYLKSLPGTKKAITRTFLKNVRVFAVNEQVTRDSGDGGNSIAAKTVSLLVIPSQVEVLTLASQIGTLSLSLRPPNDEDLGDTDDATLEEILGIQENADPDTTEKQVKANSDDQGSFGDFLENFGKSSPEVVTQPVMTESKPAWTMDLISPDGVKRFEFNKEGGLPQEVRSGGNSFNQFPVKQQRPTGQQTPISSGTPVKGDASEEISFPTNTEAEE
ncbi:MAG: Flp pilus assembly protein CpaB [Blastopirellula sp.]|nr:MAG: Flp pilus assembly protein CpaB [Blastopirellula sp.]